MTDGHPDDFLVVYVGRLGIEKRLSDLRAVLDRMPTSTRLCFVGQGPQGEQLKREFAGTRTVFLGQKTGDELSQAFASADVFCLPSDSETLGFVVLESMASGVPVIGVRAGGLLDLIADGVDGYLIEAGDTDAFVEKLRQLKDDPELRRRLGKCAREETEKWSWQSSMSKLRDEQYEQAKTNFHQRFEQRIWRMLTRKKTKQS
jgi:sulfoquinovosyltransferase